MSSNSCVLRRLVTHGFTLVPITDDCVYDGGVVGFQEAFHRSFRPQADARGDVITRFGEHVREGAL